MSYERSKHMHDQDASQERRRARSLVAGSLEEFEDSLSQRTKVPPERIVEFLSCSNAELEEQARVIEEVQRRFSTLLERCEADPRNISPFMRAMDPKAFSRDHDWRDLVQELNQDRAGREEFKHMALTKYLEYLSFRKELLQFIRTRRASPDQLSKAAEDVGLALTPDPQVLAGALKETDAFGMTRAVCMPMASDEYTKLPEKATVEFSLGEGEAVELLLASHRFELRGGPDACLVDEWGVAYHLPEGRTSVGRHIDNDIMLDPRYQEVSRFHILIDREEPDIIRLTDLSSFGTFMRGGQLERKP